MYKSHLKVPDHAGSISLPMLMYGTLRNKQPTMSIPEKKNKKQLNSTETNQPRLAQIKLYRRKKQNNPVKGSNCEVLRAVM